MTTPTIPANTAGVTFASFNLPEQLNAALARMDYTTPTSIQAQAIPFALAGRDILGSAQTGTGKTAAFSIPMIAKLMAEPNAAALVLAPTRELASQTLDVINKLTANNREMRTALLIGGEAMGKQFDQLRRDPRIIVGTPGRINDHLRRNPKMLAFVNFIAVDEADRMLDMGFSEQIDDIFATIPKERQMLMFSATFPDSIIKFSRNYLNNPERVSVSAEKASMPKIKHDVVRTTDGEKYTKLLAELEAREGSVIIFVKTQHGTERLSKKLDNDEHMNVAIHGGLRQNQREKAVRAFRNQRARIMVATDVAARGLDIPHIEHVINYDLPQVAEDYIHRIGRTARAGAEGNAMCFVVPSETGKWNAINRILNPGSAPMRGERGGEGRPNRGGFKKEGGGFRKEGNFKQREDRKRYERPDGERGFSKKPYEKREWNGDRPASEGRRDGGKPFVKSQSAPRGDSNRDFSRGNDRSAPTDRNWNAKEGRGSYTRPKEYKHEWRNEGRSTGEGRGDGRQDNYRGKKDGFRSQPRADNGYQGRGPDRGERDNARRDDSRSYGQKPGPSKTWFRSEDKGDRPAKPAFRKDGAHGNVDGAPRKPKYDKPAAAKKPFKFKEHSRKPGRAHGGKADATA
ncbi:MAG: DEAD/DEAH box helicase [Micavibrio aeruginosavorus]|nr:DEAD/DEAH box helicase [Micavibrio aeruginosavorus]